MKAFFLILTVLTFALVLPRNRQSPTAEETQAVRDLVSAVWQFNLAHPSPKKTEVNDFIDSVIFARQPGEETGAYGHRRVDFGKLIERFAARQSKGDFKSLPEIKKLSYPPPGGKTDERIVIWALDFAAPPADDDHLTHEEWIVHLISGPKGLQAKSLEWIPTHRLLG